MDALFVLLVTPVLFLFNLGFMVLPFVFLKPRSNTDWVMLPRMLVAFLIVAAVKANFVYISLIPKTKVWAIQGSNDFIMLGLGFLVFGLGNASLFWLVKAEITKNAILKGALCSFLASIGALLMIHLKFWVDYMVNNPGC